MKIREAIQRVLMAVAVLTLVIGAAADCSSAAEELSVALYQDIPTLDPHATFGEPILREVANIYEPLLRTAAKPGEWEPVLATSWTISLEGLVYTFNLRRGVQFADGTPFTAEAVKASFERIAGIKKFAYLAVAPIGRIDVVDANTVRITLKKRNNAFLSTLKLAMIVNPAAIKQHSVDGDFAQRWFDSNSAGTGPYKIDAWQRPSLLRLVKNERYWRGWKPTQFDVVKLRLGLEPDTQRLMIERGELDMAQAISIDALGALEKNNDINVVYTPFAGQMYLMLNTAAPPLNDLRVRQALSHIWNHETYNKVRRNLSPRSDGPIPLKLLGPGYSVELPKYDIERARKLLQEAGYPNGFPMMLLGHKGDIQKRTILEMFQAEAMKVGIKAEIQDMIWTAVMSRAKDWSVSRSPGSVYHTVLFYKSGDIWNPWGYVYRMFHSAAQLSKPGGQWNFSHYSNERVDSLMDVALETTDPERELKMWREVNDILVQDVPALYIDKLTDIAVMRKTVKGYVFREHYVGREYHYYELSRGK